ncbi:MAG: imidazole glycerol phosphate synthase subunit HisF [Phycisphaerales bacterium JB038]
MLMTRIIPCLDVRDGVVVKGVRFGDLRQAGDPATQAARYEAEGADEMVLLDVSATLEGRRAMLETIRRVREVLSIPLTCGGGVREAADAAAMLRAGADKVAVNSAAVADPELLGAISQQYGAQCTVLAIDAARVADAWCVVTRAGTERQALDAVQWARRGEQLGAGEILLTSWDRDGTRAGYDLELLRAVTSAVRIPVIASGGAETVSHLLHGVQAGASAVLAALIFHYDGVAVNQLKQEMQAQGLEVRL